MLKKLSAGLIIISLLLSAGCTGSTPVITGPRDITNITAAELVADMRIGWNLGNTLDAFGDTPEGFSWLADGTFAAASVTELETAWLGEDGPVTTQALFDALSEAGFNTVRIPVTWYKVVDANNDYKIRADWMARVKEIVDYAVNNDMYIILNTHHDESIFKLLGSEMTESLRAFELIWTQIAEIFRDYDEKLIFEGLNEPRTKDSRYEWSGGTREERQNLNTYMQLFIDTVRATGGNNAYRALMITPYGASTDTAAMNELRIPKDTVKDRIIASVHAYTPWEFALRNDEEAVDFWSSSNRNDTGPIHHMFNRVYDAFLSDGIPVIMGEMGAKNRNNIEARADWTEFYVTVAQQFGVPCIWWDNGAIEGDGELFGLIDRRTNEFHFPEILYALMRATHPAGARAFDFAMQQSSGQLIVAEPDVRDDDPGVPYDDEDPEPYTGDEIVIIQRENGLSLIEDEETELTTELKALVNKFWRGLLPAEEIELNWVEMYGLYREYAEAGLIEPLPEDELNEMLKEDISLANLLKVENLDIIFNDIFSERAVNIIPAYRDSATEDGFIRIPIKGIEGSYRLLLIEQAIGGETAELYFYYFYQQGGIFRSSSMTYDEETGGLYFDSPLIGRYQDDEYVFFADMLDTLGVAKYTFVLEDGKYKILSIENAA
jgi:endoglucanase